VPLTKSLAFSRLLFAFLTRPSVPNCRGIVQPFALRASRKLPRALGPPDLSSFRSILQPPCRLAALLTCPDRWDGLVSAIAS
jgi:hypothetical protein